MHQRLGSARCRHSAVTIRVPCGPVQPAADHSLAHGPYPDDECGVVEGQLPVALAR